MIFRDITTLEAVAGFGGSAPTSAIQAALQVCSYAKCDTFALLAAMALSSW